MGSYLRILAILCSAKFARWSGSICKRPYDYATKRLRLATFSIIISVHGRDQTRVALVASMTRFICSHKELSTKY